jgi:hypothetical protein
VVLKAGRSGGDDDRPFLKLLNPHNRPAEGGEVDEDDGARTVSGRPKTTKGTVSSMLRVPTHELRSVVDDKDPRMLLVYAEAFLEYFNVVGICE